MKIDVVMNEIKNLSLSALEKLKEIIDSDKIWDSILKDDVYSKIEEEIKIRKNAPEVDAYYLNYPTNTNTNRSISGIHVVSVDESNVFYNYVFVNVLTENEHVLNSNISNKFGNIISTDAFNDMLKNNKYIKVTEDEYYDAINKYQENIETIIGKWNLSLNGDTEKQTDIEDNDNKSENKAEEVKSINCNDNRKFCARNNFDDIFEELEDMITTLF